jgi:hypothetical protein
MFRKEVEWRMNPGNRLLEFITKQAISEGRLKRGDISVQGHIPLEEYIFDLGAIELNRLPVSKRKRAGKQ